MDIKGVVLGDVDWIHPACDKGPVASPGEHGSESLSSIKGQEFLNWLGDC
jgi:hypothetical protein